MPNATITNIFDGADHPIAAGVLSQVQVRPDTDLILRGSLQQSRITVGCALTHHYYDVLGGAAVWSRSVFCKASDLTWEVQIDKLKKGNYVLSVGDEGDLQTILLNVSILKPGTVVAMMEIVDTIAAADKIEVGVSINFLNNPVQFSLTPINANGTTRGPTAFHTERPNVSPWRTKFFPGDIDGNPFAGLYAFIGNSYEGRVSKTILV